MFPGACARRQCETSVAGYHASRSLGVALRRPLGPGRAAVPGCTLRAPGPSCLEPPPGYVPGTHCPPRDGRDPCARGGLVAEAGFEPAISGL